MLEARAQLQDQLLQIQFFNPEQPVTVDVAGRNKCLRADGGVVADADLRAEGPVPVAGILVGQFGAQFVAFAAEGGAARGAFVFDVLIVAVDPPRVERLVVPAIEAVTTLHGVFGIAHSNMHRIMVVIVIVIVIVIVVVRMLVPAGGNAVAAFQGTHAHAELAVLTDPAQTRAAIARPRPGVGDVAVTVVLAVLRALDGPAGYAHVVAVAVETVEVPGERAVAAIDTKHRDSSSLTLLWRSSTAPSVRSGTAE